MAVRRKNNSECKRQYYASTATLFACCSAVALICCDAYLVPGYPQSAAFRTVGKRRQTIKDYRLVGRRSRGVTITMIYAPPGSGYATPEDEKSELPDTYEPMMEYPGTMRPGRTPENQPFHDLPIGDDEPDPVPWPHFQQIEWHHRWEPPHPHPIPMEEFIEMNGRWATPEMEAAMRAGARRDVRKRNEAEESEKRETLILDDEDDDLDEDDFVGRDVAVELGDGIFGKLGSVADQAATAAAVSGRTTKQVEDPLATDEGEAFEDDDLDDFLLDLGLDAIPSSREDDDDDGEVGDAGRGLKKGQGRRSTKIAGLLDDDDVDLDLDLLVGDDDGDIDDGPIDLDLDDPSLIGTDIDTEIGLGLDDEDNLTDDGIATVPLDDFEGETLDGEEDFFDSGFDYDDIEGFDAGDMGDMW